MHPSHGSALAISLHWGLTVFGPVSTCTFNTKLKKLSKDRLGKPLTDHLCISQDQNAFFCALQLVIITIARSVTHEI